jgi:2-C-methyl-D-erythritol 4-phosphate cytidylyltransferase
VEGSPVVVIVTGAGSGSRLGGGPAKAFRRIGGRPILAVAAQGATLCPGVEQVIVTVPAGSEDEAREALADVVAPLAIVPGGDSRQASVRAALAAVPADAAVLVHDAARPFAPPELFARVLAALDDGVDAVVPVLPVTDTVVRVRAGIVAAAEPRDELSLAQTPQGFRAAALRAAHARAEAAGFAFSDDATMLHWAGFEVRTVEGDEGNVKITTVGDLAQAARRVEGSHA